MKTLITLLLFLPLFALGQTASIGDILLEDKIPSIHYDKSNEIDFSKIEFNLNYIDCSNLERCIDRIVFVNDQDETVYQSTNVEGKVEFPYLASSSYYIYFIRGNHVSAVRLHRH